MTRRALGASVASALVLFGLSGCLFHGAESPRFYRPAAIALDDTDEVAETTPAPGVPVRLAGVRSAPFLRERIVWRASPVEYGLYEQRRWFELPSRYVRRALTKSLQETAGLSLGSEATAVRLDVEVLAFDEVLAPAHEAHVALAVTARSGTETRLDRTVSAHVPIATDDGAATAEAVGRALDDVVQKVAAATARAVAVKPASAAATRKAK